MMPKQSKKTHVRIPAETAAQEPEWVINMHEHYRQTGSYRARDLDRVLGDPRKQVSGNVPTELLAARHLEEK
jgi:hypothetical protein